MALSPTAALQRISWSTINELRPSAELRRAQQLMRRSSLNSLGYDRQGNAAVGEN